MRFHPSLVVGLLLAAPAPLLGQGAVPARDSGLVPVLEHRFSDSTDTVVVALRRGVVYLVEVAGPGTPSFRDARRGDQSAFVLAVASGADTLVRRFQVHPYWAGAHAVRLADLPAGTTATLRLYGDTRETQRMAARSRRPPGLGVLPEFEPQRFEAPAEPFVRIEAGALNPDGLFNTTMAFGGAVGLATDRNTFLLRAVRQSRNRNSGQDVSDARTFVTLDWERAFGVTRFQEGQVFVRAGAGALFRSPFKSTWTVDLGAGLRYRIVPRLFIVGALVDQLAWLPSETSGQICDPFSCSTIGIRSELQHNVGLLVDLELGFR